MIVQLMFDALEPEGSLQAELLAAPRSGDMVVAEGRSFIVTTVVWYAKGERNPPLCLALVKESDHPLAAAFAEMIPQGLQLVWNRDRPDGE